MGTACSPEAGFRLALKPGITRQSPKSSHALTWQATPGNCVDTAGATPGLLRQIVRCINQDDCQQFVRTQLVVVTITTVAESGAKVVLSRGSSLSGVLGRLGNWRL
jgi:hypothetical protein